MRKVFTQRDSRIFYDPFQKNSEENTLISQIISTFAAIIAYGISELHTMKHIHTAHYGIAYAMSGALLPMTNSSITPPAYYIIISKLQERRFLRTEKKALSSCPYGATLLV